MTDNKYEGVSKICSSCNSVLVCRMTQYVEHENKLQWQNREGGAHYFYKGKDGDGKPIFECKVEPLVTSSTTSKRLTKKDFVQCPMCSENFGWFRKDDIVTLKKHIQAYHPNSEKFSIDNYKLSDNKKTSMQTSNTAKPEEFSYEQ